MKHERLKEKIIKIKKETLSNYYAIMLKHEDAVIKTINKKTQWHGVADFCRTDKTKIRVYEGNPDGSDDKTLSIDEFVKNYNFCIDLEI